MKVLYLSTWFPYPPDNGSRIRAYYLLEALARRHDVYLISLLQEDSDPENAVHLKEMCKVWSLHESRWFNPGTLKSCLGFFSSRPRSCVDTFDPSVKQAVREAVVQVQPDAIVVSTLGVSEYVPYDLRVPVVMDHHNCEYAIMKRAAENHAGALARFRYTLGWKKFARWEAAVCRALDGVAVVSDLDREDILRAAPDLRNVRVIPNGVDTEHYSPCSRAPEPGVMLYNGALTYGPNLDAVRYFVSDIYPRLQADLPRLKLMVTGRTVGVDLSGIEDSPGVELTGYVQDMRDALSRSSACIVPLRHGGGSRLKILEAMAAGVPVVSTSKGAEGIDCTDRDHLLIADGPDNFADAVRLVLTDIDLADALAESARRLVVDKYDWSAIGEAFTDLVESAICRRNSL